MAGNKPTIAKCCQIQVHDVQENERKSKLT